MKKIIFLTFILIAVGLLLSTAVPVFAQSSATASTAAGARDLLDTAAGKAGYSTEPALAQYGVAFIVGLVARIFLTLLGIIFISYTIYGGFLWMTAAGNDEKISKAKKIIRDGIIGIIIIMCSVGIYLLIFRTLIGRSTSPESFEGTGDPAIYNLN